MASPPLRGELQCSTPTPKDECEKEKLSNTENTQGRGRLHKLLPMLSRERERELENRLV